jgi:hypothetical protein
MFGSESGPRGDIVTPAVLLLVGLLLGWPSGVRAQRIATVTVVGLDYAYQAPATLRPGLPLSLSKTTARSGTKS